MKPEQRMWQQLRTSIGYGLWDATRHEDLLNKGIPDVSFGCKGINGWIELKCNPEWPAKLETIVRPDSEFTVLQRSWLMRRDLTGGHVWLLWKIKHEWLLFTPLVAQHIGKLTQLGLRKMATVRWDHVPKAPEFLSAVTGLAPACFE